MPFIDTRVSCAVSPDAERRLKTEMGNAIRLLSGKTEDYLMLAFTDHARLWFAGDNDEPTAMVEVSVFGGASHEDCDALTARLTALLGEELGIPGDRVYVKYTATQEWGWQGAQF